MARTAFFALIFLALLARSNSQEVFVPRDATKDPVVSVPSEKPKVAQEQLKAQLPKAEPAKPQVAKAQPAKEPSVTIQTAKAESPAPPPLKAQAIKTAPSIVQTMKAQPLKVAMVKTQPATPSVTEPEAATNTHVETAFTKLADGFDFPVGKPDAQGYYKARGFRSKGHLGEDWDGVGGGDTDLGDPVYSIGDGIVVFARDCHMGWGNVMIIRHAYRDGSGEVKYIDALYGHLNSMSAKRGQNIARGQQIGTMGTAHGLYDAHLHLEIRKNLEIGMSRAKFSRDFSNYYDPSQFILTHRHLPRSVEKFRVAMNTFKQDERIRWTKRNFSTYRGGSDESAAALKKALASQH